MKLKFTRKTWYFLLLASAAASMLNGFAVLSGTSFSLIEQIAFAAAGIAALFLAAEKGSASWEKRNFTGVFVLLMVSYMVNGWAGYLCSALAWPLLLSTEYKRGMAIQRQLQLVGAAEALHLFFLLMAKYGGMAALGFWTNLLWVLLACARGWAALSLYKMQEFGVVFDAFHLILDYLVDLGTDALVIILDLCFHAVISVLILKECYIRNRDISGSLACYGVVVNDNLGMEYFLVDFLIEIITD